MAKNNSTQPIKFRSKADIETELAAEKAARQQEYSDKVNAILTEGNCGLVTVVGLGEMALTVDKVLALPTQIIVIAN